MRTILHEIFSSTVFSSKFQKSTFYQHLTGLLEPPTHISLSCAKCLSFRPFNSTGTSDPYVKFKADGKQIYKSRTIPKNLNPQWNEKFCVPIEDISMPLVIKVFDFDRVSSDDPMGMVTVDLSQIEVSK